jgi:hypothetical protein
VDYFGDSAVVETRLFRNLAKGKARSLSVGEGFAPRLAHGLGISLKGRLGVTNGSASNFEHGSIRHCGEG